MSGVRFYNRRFIDNEEWRLKAKCLGVPVEVFFPNNYTKPDNVAEAKALCKECPVRAECLESALLTQEDLGVLGGKTPQERRRVVRRTVSHGR